LYGSSVKRTCFYCLSLITLAVLALVACQDLTGGAGLSDAALAAYLRLHEDDLARPAGDDPTPVPFTVEPGETVASIAQRLHAVGLIRDPELFRRYVRLRRLDTGIQAGQFELARTMNLMEIALRLQRGQAPGVLFTIPEGWRAGQIADALRRTTTVDADAFLKLVDDGAQFVPSYGFLAGLPADASLEGYLFPDTYELPEDPQARDLIERMLANFAVKALPLFETTPPAAMTMHEALTLASIIEREAVVPEERPLIAGVYLNRLRQGMRLEADPTVQYAMGFQAETGQWWKTPVTLAEYREVKSPYNTYLHAGLPPGPICNPGLDSIRAALQPQFTEFLYFVARGDGSHVFARTFEEHLSNVRRYLGQ
jgi:UPF0755 protein